MERIAHRIGMGSWLVVAVASCAAFLIDRRLDDLDIFRFAENRALRELGDAIGLAVAVAMAVGLLALGISAGSGRTRYGVIAAEYGLVMAVVGIAFSSEAVADNNPMVVIGMAIFVAGLLFAARDGWQNTRATSIGLLILCTAVASAFMVLTALADWTAIQMLFWPLIAVGALTMLGALVRAAQVSQLPSTYEGPGNRDSKVAAPSLMHLVPTGLLVYVIVVVTFSVAMLLHVVIKDPAFSRNQGFGVMMALLMLYLLYSAWIGLIPAVAAVVGLHELRNRGGPIGPPAGWLFALVLASVWGPLVIRDQFPGAVSFGDGSLLPLYFIPQLLPAHVAVGALVGALAHLFTKSVRATIICFLAAMVCSIGSVGAVVTFDFGGVDRLWMLAAFCMCAVLGAAGFSWAETRRLARADRKPAVAV